MKLSFIFELLLIFVFIAFAASAVLDKRSQHNRKSEVKKYAGRKSVVKNRQGPGSTSANRYCSCNMKLCNCCREFNLPVVSLRGPGCASLQYLKGDRLAISMSFGERVLTNTTISSKKPQPICMPLPGGISKFCGRVYNIGRKGEDFQACLGLELRSLNDIEASLRVSCFNFGPRGLRVEPSQPLPVVEEEDDDDEDDDDDDDDFDFDGDDDDEDDDSENDVETAEYGAFSVFDDDFIDQYFEAESSGTKKKPVKKPPVTVSKAPYRKPTKATVTKIHQRKPVSTKNTPKPKPQRVSTAVPTKVTITAPTKVTIAASTKVSTTASTSAATASPTTLKASEELPTSSTSLPKTSLMAEPVDIKAAVTKPSIPIPEPVNIMSGSIETSQAQYEVQTDRSELTTLQETSTKIMTYDIDTTINERIESTTLPQITTTTPKEEDDDSIESSGSEENPIAEVVEDILDESNEVRMPKNKTLKSEQPTDKTTKATMVKKESDDVDDILDGVVDTITGDDSGEDKAEDDEEDSIEDDDDEEAEEEEDDSRRRRKLYRSFGRRQSRDMWLDRLHW